MINHIGFIMDGNRRFSKENNLSKEEAYKLGLKNFIRMVKHQVEFNINETSFFALSEDNYKKRPKEELRIIFNLIKSILSIKDFIDFIKNNSIQINLKGNLDDLKKNSEIGFQNYYNKIINLNNNLKEVKFKVNILLNYDGENEIVHAFKKIVNKMKSNNLDPNLINSSMIKENIYFNNSKPPEIIIRTGKANRLSGFMLWDSKYSNIYFSDKYWPEFNRNDLLEIINLYSNSEQNFGR